MYFTSVIQCTVEPRYNEDHGTMKITLLYQVSHYIRVKKLRNIKSWDQQNHLVIGGFCYIRPLYNEVPLYFTSVIRHFREFSLLLISYHCNSCRKKWNENKFTSASKVQFWWLISNDCNQWWIGTKINPGISMPLVYSTKLFPLCFLMSWPFTTNWPTLLSNIWPTQWGKCLNCSKNNLLVVVPDC